MRVFTVTNQKGGVGKTALALHLALAGQEQGLRVLLIDLDTQGNAGITLTGDPGLAKCDGGAGDLFAGDGVQPLTTPSGIALLHGHQKLDAVDANFKLVDAVPVREAIRVLPYDLVVIDTPPAIGLRQVGPMVWCDLCLTPLEPNGYSVVGLSQTLEILSAARQLNPLLHSRTIINRHIRRSKRQKQYIEQIAARVELTQPYLCLHVAVADALDSGVPVWRFGRAARDTKEQWRAICGGLLGAPVAD
ncbi:MAG: ParA family protein [bacterium]|nr:ParA family protein [bacterium]